MGVSLSDISTTAQNIVTAINGLITAYTNVQGAQNTTVITTATLVRLGSGRICTVIVLVAGAAGAVYDANASSLTTGKIYVIPAVLGVYVVNFPVTNGIVVTPGAGQTVSVSWS